MHSIEFNRLNDWSQSRLQDREKRLLILETTCLNCREKRYTAYEWIFSFESMV